MKIAGFYHVATIGSWERVVSEQIDRLKKSGILKISPLFIGVVGEESLLSQCVSMFKE